MSQNVRYTLEHCLQKKYSSCMFLMRELLNLGRERGSLFFMGYLKDRKTNDSNTVSFEPNLNNIGPDGKIDNNYDNPSAEIAREHEADSAGEYIFVRHL